MSYLLDNYRVNGRVPHSLNEMSIVWAQIIAVFNSSSIKGQCRYKMPRYDHQFLNIKEADKEVLLCEFEVRTDVVIMDVGPLFTSDKGASDERWEFYNK